MIDLSSDTATRPSAEMRAFMARADVGDEQRREDPTVNALQDHVATLTGKDAALFLPSGTMCNAIAFAVHCRPGDAVILHRGAHPNIAEGGGPAVLAGVMLRSVDCRRGIFGRDEAEVYVDGGSTHASRTSLISVENTSNQGGGAVWPLATIQELRSLADDKGMRLHMDGARLMNAVVTSGMSAATIAEAADTVWIDLSKGLGAPVGAVLAGPQDFIDQARLWKHRLGGAMRQAGIIAAAGLYAFDRNVDRLAEDHANAKLLESALSRIPGIKLVRGPVETNIVLFEVAETGLSASEFASILLREHNVRVAPYIDGSTVRAVTHLDVSREDCKRAVSAIEEVCDSSQQTAA